MKYEYLTESVSIRVETAVRKGATQLRNVDDPTAGVRDRFNELAAEGWEFMQIGDIPVTGQTLKSGAYRVIAIAIFRRQLAD
ncbi:MAG: hypothetical protein BMS9Abin20_0950 [Acidimicrobiia bacterium]|nr:MAG: hypothetical protein BMS9Abin20_0950 [Acidimicrobiia bacterium]